MKWGAKNVELCLKQQNHAVLECFFAPLFFIGLLYSGVGVYTKFHVVSPPI